MLQGCGYNKLIKQRVPEDQVLLVQLLQFCEIGGLASEEYLQEGLLDAWVDLCRQLTGSK